MHQNYYISFEIYIESWQRRRFSCRFHAPTTYKSVQMSETILEHDTKILFFESTPCFFNKFKICLYLNKVHRISCDFAPNWCLSRPLPSFMKLSSTGQFHFRLFGPGSMGLSCSIPLLFSTEDIISVVSIGEQSAYCHTMSASMSIYLQSMSNSEIVNIYSAVSILSRKTTAGSCTAEKMFSILHQTELDSYLFCKANRIVGTMRKHRPSYHRQTAEQYLSHSLYLFHTT